MALVAQPGTPVSVPMFVHLILWPALIAWCVFLYRRRKTRTRPYSWRVGAALAPACLFTDAAALLAAIRWPTHASNGFVLALLWIAVLFSVTSYFALRTRGDGGDGGDGSEEETPEPPWWPDFERDLRDYVQRGPRPPSKPPRAPAGVE